MISNMGRYLCHKEVDAAKITNVEHDQDGGYRVHYQDAQYQPAWTVVPWTWYDRHQPHIGGYLVQYVDGYLSFSPADAFEGGYSRIAHD